MINNFLLIIILLVIFLYLNASYGKDMEMGDGYIFYFKYFNCYIGEQLVKIIFL